MKKKNLLKCLALTSMLALSVGAVTSCGTQGEAGKDGAQGAQGVQGAQGEKGDKGDKGDPVYTVVLLSEGVSTDKISGISGETYTLTFDASASGVTGAEIVTSLSINYEEVPLTEEILNGSYTGTFSSEMKNGAVVVSAKFGTVKSYGEGLFDDYYDALVAKDAQLQVREITDDTPELVAAKRGSYYNTTVKGVYATERGKVATKVASFKDTDTSIAKVAAIKEVVAAGEKAIDAKYAEVLAAAKVSATTAANSLYNNGVAPSGSKFSSEDRAKELASCKTAIEASTNLQGISDAIDNGGTLTAANYGSYNKLEALRSNAMSEIKDYIDGVEAGDPAFASDNVGHAALIALLKEYNITELPETVAEAQYKVLSAATTLTPVASTVTDSKTGSVEGDAAYKAVKDANDAIVSTLKTSIRAKYDAEINASKVVTEAGDRQNISNIVGTAIAEWCGDASRSAGIKISDMVSYIAKDDTDVDITTNYDEVDISKSGLLGYIETRLSVLINPSFISSAFVTERLSAAKATQIAAMKAAKEEYLKDARYAEAVSYLTHAQYTATTLSAETKDLYNATAVTFEGVTGGVHYLKEIGPKASKVANGIGGAAGDDLVLKYATDTGETTGINATAVNTILAINNYGTNAIGAYATLYATAVGQYEGVQALEVATSTVETGTVHHTEAEMQQLFKDVVEDTANDGANPIETLDGIDGVVALVPNWIICVKELDTKYNEFVAGKSDLVFAGVAAADDNELYKMYEEELAAITAGTVTTKEAVDSWADGLGTLYTTGVSAYLTKIKGIYTDSYKAYLAGTNATEAAKYEAAYSSFVALAGTKDYPCDTYTSIQNWFNTGIRKLENVKSLILDDTFVPLVAAIENSTSSNGVTIVDNSAKIDTKSTYTNIAYDQEITISAVSGQHLAEETNTAAKALFPLDGFKVNGKLYLVSFTFDGTGTFTDNGYIKVPALEEVSGYKTISLTAASHANWNDMLVAVTGEKDFVIEYSYDGITSYRIHVVLKASLLA